MALLGTSTRNQQLDKLAQRLPFENEQALDLQNQAATTQLQQAVATAPANASPQQAQQLGAQSAAQRGQLAAQSSQQAQNQQAQLTQLAMQERSRQGNAALNQLQLGLTKKERQLQSSLAQLGREYKNELFDKQLQFNKDELGRTAFNERQLQDYALLKARGVEDMRDYEQKVRQYSQRRMKMLEASLAKIKQAMQQEADASDQELNQETKKKLAIAKAELEKKLSKEAMAQRNRASMFAAGGTIVGAIAGGVIGTFVTPGLGTAAGASIGAAAGGALGTAAAGATS